MTNQSICNICGANYVYRNGRWMCPACGAYKAEELSNEEVTLLYHAAQKLRLADFGEAELAYDDIVQKYPQNAEGYWGRLLARYGIKYEEDFDGKKIPTCYATTIESVMGDRDYQRVLELAEPDMQVYYARQANYIERVRKEWVEKASREAPYDVFICYKDSDLANGIDRTQDSIAAQELYIHLVEQGYRVFFSRESLRDKVGEKYEPYIFNALSTAKVMLVYGTNSDYITSTWLKNEWTRYEKRIRAGEKQEGSLVTVCDGFSPNELPHILATAQCFDATKRSFYSDLDKYVKKYVRGEENSTATATTAQVLSGMPDQAQLERILRKLAEEDAEKQAKQAELERIAAEKQAELDRIAAEKQARKEQKESARRERKEHKLLAKQEKSEERKNKSHTKGIVFISLLLIPIIVLTCIFVPRLTGEKLEKPINSDYSNNTIKTHSTTVENNNAYKEPPEQSNEYDYQIIGQSVTITRYNGDATAFVIPKTINGKTVTEIGKNAFLDCLKLESVEIPNTVTTIGESAFRGCISLMEVVIPDSVKEIEWRAFENCYSLKEVVVPSSVTIINNNLFMGCSSLESVTLPQTITSIGIRAFWGCSSLEEISIPKLVTKIESNLFINCSSLKKVTLPNCITSIGSWAFGNCSSLESIMLPNSVKTIGENAFNGCSSLQAINVPSSVITINQGTFQGCTSVQEIILMGNVTTIGDNAFRNCSSIVSIGLPETVISIGKYAFSDCSSLQTVNLYDTAITKISEGLFMNCSSLVDADCSDHIISIGNYAFSNCTALQSMSMPNSLTSIGSYAFKGCTTIGAVVIPKNVVTVGEYAFSGWNSEQMIFIESYSEWNSNWNGLCNAIIKHSYN